MSKKLYVVNLKEDIRHEVLKALFSEFGVVSDVKICIDEQTGQSKGFGFVEMDSEPNARAAFTALNNKDIGGQNMKIYDTKPFRYFC